MKVMKLENRFRLEDLDAVDAGIVKFAMLSEMVNKMRKHLAGDEDQNCILCLDYKCGECPIWNGKENQCCDDVKGIATALNTLQRMVLEVTKKQRYIRTILIEKGAKTTEEISKDHALSSIKDVREFVEKHLKIDVSKLID
jgi:hypothetical protein